MTIGAVADIGKGQRRAAIELMATANETVAVASSDDDCGGDGNA